MEVVSIDGNSLNLEEFINVVRKGYKVRLTEEAIERVNKSRRLVDEFVEDEKVVYGITTGFGKFSDVSITKDETKRLQKSNH